MDVKEIEKELQRTLYTVNKRLDASSISDTEVYLLNAKANVLLALVTLKK